MACSSFSPEALFNNTSDMDQWNRKFPVWKPEHWYEHWKAELHSFFKVEYFCLWMAGSCHSLMSQRAYPESLQLQGLKMMNMKHHTHCWVQSQVLLAPRIHRQVWEKCLPSSARLELPCGFILIHTWAWFSNDCKWIQNAHNWFQSKFSWADDQQDTHNYCSHCNPAQSPGVSWDYCSTGAFADLASTWNWSKGKWNAAMQQWKLKCRKWKWNEGCLRTTSGSLFRNWGAINDLAHVGKCWKALFTHCNWASHPNGQTHLLTQSKLLMHITMMESGS